MYLETVATVQELLFSKGESLSEHRNFRNVKIFLGESTDVFAVGRAMLFHNELKLL